jgi:DNA polymerase V
MSILSTLAPEAEIYSIDECFLNFTSWTNKDLLEYGFFVKERVKQWTGIPISIGLAPTKTLAKAANKVAKKAEGVKLLRESEEIDTILEKMDVGDLWGIGRQYAKFLKSHQINNALQLKNKQDGFIEKYLTVVGLRLVYELRGIPCLPIELVAPPKKTICTSRGFGRSVTELKHLEEAVSTFAAICTQKLRKQQGAARMLTVFIHTNTFNFKIAQYSNSRQVKLLVATDNTAEIISYALAALRHIYREGFEYKRAGIIITSIVPKSQIQQSIFDEIDRSKRNKLMQVMDEINHKMGKNTLKFAIQGPIKGASWQMKQSNVSPCYTTRWDDVLKAK